MRTSPLRAFIDKDKTKKEKHPGFDISKITVDGVPAEEVIKIEKEKEKSKWNIDPAIFKPIDTKKKKKK
tara:strand:+ start:120 stop:326 length:207 start_codon:yes stop_codon:yes gene_type:complete